MEEQQSTAPAASGGGDSVVTVIVAFVANLLIAVAKTVAASLTSSASMLAEAAHSWADAGNEIFLLVADRRSDRGRDVRHPMGYGREAYVWSMFAAFGLFTAGAVVGLRDPARARERRIARGAATTGPRSWSEAFNLSALLYGFGSLVLLGFDAIPVLVALFVGWLIFACDGAARASNGLPARTPLAIPFVRG